MDRKKGVVYASLIMKYLLLVSSVAVSIALQFLRLRISYHAVLYGQLFLKMRRKRAIVLDYLLIYAPTETYVIFIYDLIRTFH